MAQGLSQLHWLTQDHVSRLKVIQQNPLRIPPIVHNKVLGSCQGRERAHCKEAGAENDEHHGRSTQIRQTTGVYGRMTGGDSDALEPG